MATIHQDSSRTYSRLWLGTPANLEATASRIIEDAKGRPCLIVADRPSGRVIESALQEMDADFTADIEISDFNATTCKKRWSNLSCMFVVGVPTNIKDGSSPADMVEHAIGHLHHTADDIYVFGTSRLSLPVHEAKPVRPRIGNPVLAKMLIEQHGFIILNAAAMAPFVNMNVRTVRHRFFREAHGFKIPTGFVAFRFQEEGQGHRMIVGHFDPDRFDASSMRRHIKRVVARLAAFGTFDEENHEQASSQFS